MVESRRIVELVADPYPPYQFKKNNEVTGVDYEIVIQAFQAAGIEAHVQLFPWEKSITLMENREADGIFQIMRSAERERLFIFSDILRVAKTVFFKKAPLGISFDPVLDIGIQLKKNKIGVVAGYSYGPFIDNLEESKKIEEHSQKALLTGLVKEWYRLALMDVGVGTYLIKELGRDDIVRVDGFEIERELFIAFQKDGHQLVQEFNAGLYKIRKSGLFKRTFIGYGLEPLGI